MALIRVITPLCSMSDEMAKDTMNEVNCLSDIQFSFDNVVLGVGPASIENSFDEAYTAPLVAIKAMEAEQDGCQAVIIDCMGDPGMHAAREAVSIPVIGPGECAMHMAATLGHQFSCVSILDSVRPIFFDHARIYGIGHKLASVRTIGVGVTELEKYGAEQINAMLLEQSLKCIQEDHADSIILGCTGFVGVAEWLQQELEKQGFAVPVINPLPTAALQAIAMIRGKIRHSKRAYKKPNLQKYEGVKFPSPDTTKR
ncbi:aspartate/glutamate racemase family protein [Govanella unica]|uniref:Aspartate/glutamate racemase family protein n=1 Tax=Govanella unica TaxID=2975056 RepID=A0A9X3Z7C5_9PROT|nr:aspartate/glutamate racemase family protein [Govania unica]MDA5193834.1 aspartate/glutamate racemase family protein [Govania unica]